MQRSSVHLLVVVLTGVGACSSSPPQPDAALPQADARIDLPPGGIPAPAGVRVQDRRCLISVESYLAWAESRKQQPCLPTAAEMLARIEAGCASTGGRSRPVVRCDGRLSFPLVDQVKAGTVCTYDSKTGAFAGAEIALEGGFWFCNNNPGLVLETEPVITHCGRWYSGTEYCGPGVYGQSVAPVTGRPVTFTLRNETGTAIVLDDPGSLGRSWSILAGGQPLELARGDRCECPNQHCIVEAGTNTSGNLAVAAGAETSWQWDGRVATVEGTLMTCERLSTASDGPMVIRVKFERNEGAGPSGMAEAAFTNPPAAPVVITVR